MSRFCIIDDANSLCNNLLAEIEEMEQGEKRACLAQIHQWFLDLVQRAEDEAMLLTEAKEEAEDESIKWEEKYNDSQLRVDELEYKLEECEPDPDAWRKDPDPYGLHGLTGQTVEQYFCGGNGDKI